MKENSPITMRHARPKSVRRHTSGVTILSVEEDFYDSWTRPLPHPSITLKKMNKDVQARILALILVFGVHASAAAQKVSGSGISFTPVDSSPYFDIPVTYNTKVKWWINYFQTGGRRWFRTWLERSH